MKKLTVKDLAQMAMMIAIIEVCKVTLSFLPNIELTSFWVILFTIYFGWKILFVIPAFILIEGAMYGFGLWWIMYLYTWPILAILASSFRKNDSAIFWSVLSSVFGLSFGALCSFPYFFIGMSAGGIKTGLVDMFTWWVAGIPWDIVHGIGNFVLMFVLYKPVSMAMKKIAKQEV